MSRSKHTERRKELTGVAMAKNWFKANEKLFWVLLLVVICFSFGFTMAPTQIMSQFANNQVYGKIGDETVTVEDWKTAGTEINLIQTRFPSPVLDFSSNVLTIWDYLLFQHEADRRDIVVSREELGERIRTVYWSLQAVFNSDPNNPADRANMQGRVEELRDANQWNEDEYVELLKRVGVKNPRFFEKAIANFIKIEKLKNLVEQPAVVSPDEVTDIFNRIEQFRKLSFFKFELDEDRQKEIAEKLTDDDLREFYDENESKFRFYGPELRLDYVFVPTAHFEETVELTEVDILDKYDVLKKSRFQRVLDADLEEPTFSLLSEDEEKARDEKLFLPLSEVREEVIAELKSERAGSNAQALVRELGQKLIVRKRGSVGDSADVDADEAIVSLEDVKREHPFVDVGTTEWFNGSNARDKLENLYNVTSVSVLSQTANKNRALDAEEREEYTLSPNGGSSRDEDGYVLYSEVRARYPNETDFEDHAEEAREKLAVDRLLDELEETVEPLISQTADGTLDLAKVAEQFGATVHSTPFIGRSDPVNVPIEEDQDEEDKADDKTSQTDEGKDDAEDDKPTTERLKGDYIVRSKGFSIAIPGHGKVARDDFNGQLFVVRFEDKRNPDSDELTPEKKRQFLDGLEADHRNAIFVQWRKELWQRTRPAKAYYGLPLSREGEQSDGEQSAPQANASVE